MIDTVAQHMDQRVADHFYDRSVQLGLLPLDDELHFLIQFLRQVTNHARKATEHAFEGQHTRLHYFVLQLVHDTPDMYGRFIEAIQKRITRILLFEALTQTGNSGTVYDKFADKIQQFVQARHIDSYRCVLNSRFSGLRFGR